MESRPTAADRVPLFNLYGVDISLASKCTLVFWHYWRLRTCKTVTLGTAAPAEGYIELACATLASTASAANPVTGVALL